MTDSRAPEMNGAARAQESTEIPSPPKATATRPRRTTRGAMPRQPVEAVAMPNLDRYRVGLTVRIHPGISDALRRAQLEQKLRRQAPETQQEIVEIALQGWLQEHGYLN